MVLICLSDVFLSIHVRQGVRRGISLSDVFFEIHVRQGKFGVFKVFNELNLKGIIRIVFYGGYFSSVQLGKRSCRDTV